MLLGEITGVPGLERQLQASLELHSAVLYIQTIQTLTHRNDINPFP